MICTGIELVNSGIEFQSFSHEAAVHATNGLVFFAYMEENQLEFYEHNLQLEIFL